MYKDEPRHVDAHAMMAHAMMQEDAARVANRARGSGGVIQAGSLGQTARPVLAGVANDLAEGLHEMALRIERIERAVDRLMGTHPEPPSENGVAKEPEPACVAAAFYAGRERLTHLCGRAHEIAERLDRAV